MHVDKTERLWVILSFIIAFVMIGILGAYAINANIHPPSNVETIDSAALHLSEEFAEDKIGIREDEDGNLVATIVAARYGFYPLDLKVPANTPIKFRIASADVLHGVHTQDTNMNTMVVPGYVSELTTSFPRAGRFPMFCNEYCGLGHDYMWSRLTVVSKEEFQLPGKAK